MKKLVATFLIRIQGTRATSNSGLWYDGSRQALAGPLNPPRPLRAGPLPRPTIARPAHRRRHRCRAQVLWPATQRPRSSWRSPRS